MARGVRPGSAWKVGAVAAILAAAAAVLIVKGLETPRPQTEPDLSVRVGLPQERDIRRVITLNSWVSSQATVVVVPKVAGTLLALDVDVGYRVKAGDRIGLVDPAPYELALEQARVARDGARNEYERARKLFESGSTGQQNLDMARTQAESASAQYDIARLNYDNTRITAPVSGEIVNKSSNVGSLVSTAVPIVTISADGELLVSTQVPERYAPRFFPAPPARVTVSAAAASLADLPARIRSVSPFVKSETRTFEVTCALEGRHPALLPGMFVSVGFVLDSVEGIPALPLTALDGSRRAWALDRDSMTVRPVDLSKSFTDGVWIALDEGYEGREFVTEGQYLLKEGARVRVLENGAAGTEGEPK